MDLTPLFREPILRQTYLDPGYTDHASDVWLVVTPSEQVVVRFSRITEFPANPFQFMAHCLFGVDPRQVHDLEALNQRLHVLSAIPVPRVLRKGVAGNRPAVVLEKMPGQQLDRLRGQPHSMLHELGAALAGIHSQRFDWCGSPAGGLRYPPDRFPLRVASTLEQVAQRYHADNPAVMRLLIPMVKEAKGLPPPVGGALIMPDLDPSQFLTDGHRITALVDTEFYAIGPAELDLIALEYVLDAASADAFTDGYVSVRPMPEPGPVRRVYRFLYRLMEVQGSVNLDDWLSWPHYF